MFLYHYNVTIAVKQVLYFNTLTYIYKNRYKYTLSTITKHR